MDGVALVGVRVVLVVVQLVAGSLVSCVTEFLLEGLRFLVIPGGIDNLPGLSS